MTAGSHLIENAWEALQDFFLRKSREWAKNYSPIWPWIAALNELIAAGYNGENKAAQYAPKSILEQQQDDAGWPDGYELRVVPTLISLGIIAKNKF